MSVVSIGLIAEAVSVASAINNIYDRNENNCEVDACFSAG